MTSTIVRVDRHRNMKLNMFPKNAKLIAFVKNDKFFLCEKQNANVSIIRKAKFILQTDNRCKTNLTKEVFSMLKEPKEIILSKSSKYHIIENITP